MPEVDQTPRARHLPAAPLAGIGLLLAAGAAAWLWYKQADASLTEQTRDRLAPRGGRKG